MNMTGHKYDGHEYDGPVQILPGRIVPDRILWEWETKMADRIALVDDDQNILTSVSLTLESEGFDVDCYHDGEAALVGLARRPANLGVFDIKMPRMDGMELLQKVRGQSQMPVIFLTSKDDELDGALGLGMGADDYITKPFSQNTVKQVLLDWAPKN